MIHKTLGILLPDLFEQLTQTHHSNRYLRCDVSTSADRLILIDVKSSLSTLDLL